MQRQVEFVGDGEISVVYGGDAQEERAQTTELAALAAFGYNGSSTA